MSLHHPPLPEPTPYHDKKPGDLFLAVLPMVHYSKFFSGVSYEEVMTLVPERSFATEFIPQIVDSYINTFREASEEKYVGPAGPSRRFRYSKHLAENGRIFVVVNQYGG